MSTKSKVNNPRLVAMVFSDCNPMEVFSTHYPHVFTYKGRKYHTIKQLWRSLNSKGAKLEAKVEAINFAYRHRFLTLPKFHIEFMWYHKFKATTATSTDTTTDASISGSIGGGDSGSEGDDELAMIINTVLDTFRAELDDTTDRLF